MFTGPSFCLSDCLSVKFLKKVYLTYVDEILEGQGMVQKQMIKLS